MVVAPAYVALPRKTTLPGPVKVTLLVPLPCTIFPEKVRALPGLTDCETMVSELLSVTVPPKAELLSSALPRVALAALTVMFCEKVLPPLMNNCAGVLPV